MSGRFTSKPRIRGAKAWRSHHGGYGPRSNRDDFQEWGRIFCAFRCGRVSRQRLVCLHSGKRRRDDQLDGLCHRHVRPSDPDAAREAGGFLARIFGGALENIGGAASDSAALFRWKNRRTIYDKMKAIADRRAVQGKLTPIPMGTAIPILEHASLEDNSDLHDMWAALIMNTAENPSTARQAKTFAEILANLTPADALFLRDFTDAEKAMRAQFPPQSIGSGEKEP